MPKKKNDAKPSEKLLSLFTRLLFDGREASLKQLSSDLDCSKQTVMRLIDQMEASKYGKLLYVKRGREAFYQLDRPKSLPKISLNAEGLYQLALCRDFLLHLLPESMRKSMEATLQQASAFLPENDSSNISDTFGTSFYKGRIDYTPYQDMLQTMIQGIRKHKVCAVRYKSARNKEAKDFAYAPKRLVAFRETIYIHGWIVTEEGKVQAKHDTSNTLALHRLKKVEIAERGAEHLPEPVDGNSGAFGMVDNEPFTAKINFAESVATYVAEREWSTGQKIKAHKDGRITLTLAARSSLEFIAWILSFGDTAEVLSPKWLRDKVADKVNTLAALYAVQGS
jgi:predicted DNA-binding transcriptional regulator YafY